MDEFDDADGYADDRQRGTFDPALFAPLNTDDQIVRRVLRLVGHACGRQLWLMFLDDRAVQIPTVMPVGDNVSPLPDSFAANLARVVSRARDCTPIASLIFVWERPGGPIASAADRHDAASLAFACADVGVPVRAQLISHDHGVRLLGPGEYADLADLRARGAGAGSVES